ncbi:hypothetical protein DFQ05_0532 [Winogradskyella wandonensis]|uniref:Uncharacterized protein n=1 Tax=Winogradskyella wandonensis TaxID=1442586 RepID=A0A4V2PU50_9FLAO|nr:hypothetical protein DFQ05_0532 [Winogradskyella wandonensis]
MIEYISFIEKSTWQNQLKNIELQIENPINRIK